MNSLGERIFELRTEKGMSQSNLADLLYVSRQTISKWENNQSIPEVDRIIAMSEIFGVSVDYIVKGEVSPSGNTEIKENTAAEPSAPTKTVKINTTKSYISGISVSVSVTFLLSLLLGIRGLVASILYTDGGYNSIFAVVGMVLNILAVASLLSLNRKMVGISYAAYTVSGIASLAVRGFGITSVLSVAAYTVMAYLCFRGNKRSTKPLCISACLLFLIQDALSLGSAAYNFHTVAQFTPRNIIMSLISMLISQIPSLIFHIGVCAVMYLKVNPLPDREIPESTADKRGMYIPLVKHVLLTLFTLGIYDCIWICRTTESLNCDSVNERQSGFRKLLLCVFGPFYRIYWYYVQSKRLEALMKQERMTAEGFAVVLVVLAVFLPVAVPSAFLQMKVNEFAGKRINEMNDE